MTRFHRLRKSSAIRDLVRETRLTAHDLIQPFFVIEGKGKHQAVASMPGVERYSTDLLLKAVEEFMTAGGKAGLLFGVPAVSVKKDPLGKGAYAGTGIVQKAVREIKKRFPQFYVITDVCLCAYTSHGHCGVVNDGTIDNDRTIEILGKVAVSHARAGSDMVAPSDMMDFRVRRIRDDLDANRLTHTAILSYAVKYASSYYGPFREAAHSSPAFGDRKTYQMDCANAREALKEARQDVREGADMVMVKPALAYLDIIKTLRDELTVPIVAYQVSGEYAVIKAAAEKKWIDEKEMVLENLVAMKRAGADLVITYYARNVLSWLRQNR